MLAGEIEYDGKVPILRRTFENRPADELRLLAQQITREHTCVVLFGNHAEKHQLVFSCHEALAQHMGSLMGTVCKSTGGRDGGNAQQAMGGCPESSGIDSALRQAARILNDQQEEAPTA